MQLVDLFLLQRTPYEHACRHPRSPLWATGCLLTTGAVYGLLVALFQRALGGDIQGVPLAQISDMILFGGNLLSGILVALVFHGGVTLVVWLMARAVGGPGRLSDLYRATAYLMPLAILILPRLALDSAAQGRDVTGLPFASVYRILAWVGVMMMVIGLYQLIRVTQGTAPYRTAAAVFLVALFCYAVLLISS